jgi:hypothetical protein
MTAMKLVVEAVNKDGGLIVIPAQDTEEGRRWMHEFRENCTLNGWDAKEILNAHSRRAGHFNTEMK